MFQFLPICLSLIMGMKITLRDVKCYMFIHKRAIGPGALSTERRTMGRNLPFSVACNLNCNICLFNDI